MKNTENKLEEIINQRKKNKISLKWLHFHVRLLENDINKRGENERIGTIDKDWRHMHKRKE